MSSAAASDHDSGDGDDLVAPLEGRFSLKDMNKHVQEIQQVTNAKIEGLATDIGTIKTDIQRLMAILAGEAPPAQNPIPAPQAPQAVPQVIPQIPAQAHRQAPQAHSQVPDELHVQDGHDYPPLRPLAPGPVQNGQLREENGDLSFGVAITRRRDMTAQEQRVWNAWPEVVLERDVAAMGQTQEKNKVTIPQHLRLDKADHTVFPKLREIQKLLRMNLVPWNLWATRVSLELDDDFLQVQAWADQAHPDWLTFVEGIIQHTHQHGHSYNTVSQFLAMLPYQNEALVAWMGRYRKAYYSMPADQRNQYHIRVHIIDKLKAYTGGVWADIAHQADRLTTAQLFDTAVAAAKQDAARTVQSAIFRPPSTTINLQGPTAPFYELTIRESTDGKPAEAQITQPPVMKISNPVTDDRAAHAARETDKCHNCGKTGHWARDCRSKSNTARQPTKFPRRNGEEVTIKGVLWKNRITDGFRKFTKSKPKGKPRAHLADDGDDDTSTQAPSTDSDEDEEGKPDPTAKYERTFEDELTAFAAGEDIL
jgi:hypothetical protein